MLAYKFGCFVIVVGVGLLLNTVCNDHYRSFLLCIAALSVCVSDFRAVHVRIVMFCVDIHVCFFV